MLSGRGSVERQARLVTVRVGAIESGERTVGESRVPDETSAQGVVQWAEQVAVSVLPPDDQAAVLELCEVIRQRDDPGRSLTVGVFGQYSSGKSTLLNALLGTGLLPASVRVTTSLATRLRPADRESLTITLRSGRRVLEFGTGQFSTWYASLVPGSEPSGIKEALSGIIRSHAAEAIDWIDLELTNTILGPGVLVIDTPGFDTNESGPQEITKLVADDVDLAIVLIPANDPGSISLARFLTEVLHHLGDRCVFVLTKFRQVPAIERPELAEYIMSWLKTHGFTDPTVIRADSIDIVAAGGNQVPFATPGGYAASEVWLDAAVAEAKAIASQLGALAADHRQQLIAATLEVMLGRLLADVTQAVEQRQAELELARAQLAEVPIVNLHDFLLGWRGTVAGELARSASRSIRIESWASQPDLALKWRRELAIKAVSPRADVRAIADQLIGETEQILNDWMQLALWRAADSSGRDLARQAEQLRRAFVAQYARLAELTGANPEPPPLQYAIAPIPVPYVDLATAFASLREQGQHLRTIGQVKTAGGALTGAVVGSMFAPVVGTLVGLTAGGLAGSISRGKQPAAFAESALAMHDEGLTAARNAVQATEPDLLDRLNQVADELVAGYLKSAGPAVERLTSDLQAQVAWIGNDLRKILTIAAEASQHQAQLNEPGSPCGEGSDDA
jgi:dynamin family protein